MKRTIRLLTFLAIANLATAPMLAVSLQAPHEATLSSSAPVPSLAGRVLAVLGGGLAFGMAIRIKDVGTLANKFKTRANAAAGEYKDGVAQAGGDWETNTKNSEGSYEQGVQAAIGRKAYGKGVSDAGGAKYVQRATELGSQRYGPGVNAGASEWAKNTQPYLQKLASLTLPPRGPRRSPQNQNRANVVAMELGKMKEQG